MKFCGMSIVECLWKHVHVDLIQCVIDSICPHCRTGEETAKHLLLFCPKWAAECHCDLGDSTDITDCFRICARHMLDVLVFFV